MTDCNVCGEDHHANAAARVDAGTPTPDLEAVLTELTRLRDENARLRAHLADEEAGYEGLRQLMVKAVAERDELRVQRQAALDLCDTMIASLDPRDVNIVVVIRRTLEATE